MVMLLRRTLQGRCWLLPPPLRLASKYCSTSASPLTQLSPVHQVAKEVESIPYINADFNAGKSRKFALEVYGCQMNMSDSEVVRSVLLSNRFEEAKSLEEADVVLLLTCAIREGAEQKIWNRLGYLKSLKNRRKTTIPQRPVQIGILGCMAERLRTGIIEKEPMVDVIAGPDSYRDLPRLLHVAADSGMAAVNVILSMDETYASVTPVRLSPEAKTAFVTVMRGCDNMCSFCIVPFTRGRERSRPIDSVVDEISRLVESGVKEVTLLGQNVNSYRDTSRSADGDGVTHLSSPGFSTVYKSKVGGSRFVDLLDKVSLISKELRIRFTSPHPKDFPGEVLQLLRERPNICRQIHLPAQSGSNAVLKSMNRNYTREAYLELVHKMREMLPGVSITGDFMAGFCGEREEDHLDTVSLIHQVGYSFAYCFPYSMREKTKAFHRLVDDVPMEVKQRRTAELITAFREESLAHNRSLVGTVQLVLVEGLSKRSSHHWAGRSDGGVKVILAAQTVPDSALLLNHDPGELRLIRPGDYVACQIEDASSQVVQGRPLYITLMESFYSSNNTS